MTAFLRIGPLLTGTLLAGLLALSPAHADATPMGDHLRLRSAYPFAQTLDRLRDSFAQKGIHIFAQIDHADAARSVGLEMPPTVVLIYGNPKLGTPLMQDSPDFALELPLRVLVRQDAGTDGAVFVTLARAPTLEGRHGLTAGMTAPLSGAETLIANTIGAQLP